VDALQHGPVLTNIQARSDYFKFYTGGILNNQCCFDTTQALDHTLLIIGWGVQGGKSYWVLRNSWGSSWGENGHIRMTITKDGFGICG